MSRYRVMVSPVRETPEGRRRSRPVLVGNDARSYYAGLRRCSSGWDCPYCMPQITSVRADEISLLVGSWIRLVTARRGDADTQA